MNTTDEKGYIDLVQRVLEHGEVRRDRTGTGTRAIFAPGALRFNLTHHFPLLTTRRLSFHNILHELFFFLRGATDVRELQRRNVHIWDKNAAEHAMRVPGAAPGDLGANYVSACHSVDPAPSNALLMAGISMATLGRTISRLCHGLWNVSDLNLMCLFPCHMMAQFFVHTPHGGAPRASLSCILTQRSADLGLGLPYNIASYALLTRLLAHVCDMEARELIISIGDAHVYEDHRATLRAQCMRTAHAMPLLEITTPPGGGLDALLALNEKHVILHDYVSHAPLHMAMSV